MSNTALSQKGIIDPKIIIGGVIALVVIFFLATGNFKFSASRSDQPVSPSEVKAEPKSYQSDQYGFSLQYPEDWSFKGAKAPYVAVFSSPLESSSDKYSEFLGVKVVSISSKPDISLQEATDLWEEQTMAESTSNDFKVVERKSTTISGKTGSEIVYTLNIEDIPAKGFVRIVLANNNVYIFQYFAETDKYDKYLPDIDSILSSVIL